MAAHPEVLRRITSAGSRPARRGGARRAAGVGDEDMGKLRRRWAWCLTPLMFASGCAGFWDEVTSRDFHPRNLFTTPDAMTVLAESDDGTRRAQALARLHEPAQNGGNQRDQDVYVEVLTKTASGDRDPLCRMAAVKTLGRYRDERAAVCLKTVTEQPLPFTSDFNHMIRLEALKALGDSGSEVAMRQLIRVAKEPPVEGSAQDRQEVIDRRMRAVDGLGKYNHADAHEALLHVLKNDRDAGLRTQSHRSLVASTGKHYAPDPQAWDQHLHPERHRGEPIAQEQGPGVLDYLTWPIRLVTGD